MSKFKEWWKKYVGVRLPDQLGCRVYVAEDAYEAGRREDLDLLQRCQEVIDDELENRPARHSLGKLHAELFHRVESLKGN